MLRILNVAEKPSVAKEIARHLGDGCQRQTTSKARYNPVWELQTSAFNQADATVSCFVTSVRGHVMEMEFPSAFKVWHAVPPESLFSAPITKNAKEDCKDVVSNIRQYCRGVDTLVLWLDCDREGENIAFEVVSIACQVNPKLRIFRANFSALTKTDILRAWANLGVPDENLSAAVDCRQELDLRVGAAITRFLTLRYKSKAPPGFKVLSFGLCQIPTLGFVVERALQRRAFIVEPFWFLKLKAELQGKTYEFSWERQRLYDLHAVEVFLEKCRETSSARIVTAATRQTTHRRPVPLSTTAMTVLAARQLKMSSKACMQAAESLYQKGLVSYPRTETEVFAPSIGLASLVATLAGGNAPWSSYAASLGEPRQPLQGKGDDKAHPPIHPVKCVEGDQLSKVEWDVYNLICRHFLAVVSDDAKGALTTYVVEMNGERFTLTGLVVIEANFLQVYSQFDSWGSGKQSTPNLRENEVFSDVAVEIVEGRTTPPNLISEAELIKLMDTHGIGTDATMHEHIQTIQDRRYVDLEMPSRVLRPTELGMALVQGFRQYGAMDFSQPQLRAEMELNLARIARGERRKEDVLKESVGKIAKFFAVISRRPQPLDSFLIHGLSATTTTAVLPSSRDTLRQASRRRGSRKQNKKNRDAV